MNGLAKTIDILAFLEKVVKSNTKAYLTDFSYDVETLRGAVHAPKEEDRTFYWMSRRHGTWCVKEREVFLKGTGANSIWTYYENSPDTFKAYRVVLTEEKDGKLMGQVFPLNYMKQLHRIKAAALPISRVSGTTEDGTPFAMPYAEYKTTEQKIFFHQHGGVKSIRFEPESEDELQARIATEHHIHTGHRSAPRKRNYVTR